MENISHSKTDKFSFLADSLKWDKEKVIPPEVFSKLMEIGTLRRCVSAASERENVWDELSYDLSCIGKESASLLSLIIVNLMASTVISKYVQPSDNMPLLQGIESGENLVAIGFSEEGAGSDLGAIETSLSKGTRKGEFLLNGGKKWISGAMYADHFLVYARHESEVGFVLLKKDSPGMTVEPCANLSAFKAAGLGNLSFEDCRVSEEQMLGFTDKMLSAASSLALQLGRFAVAWGSVGMQSKCCELAFQRSLHRKVFGSSLHKKDLNRRKLALMRTNYALSLAISQKMTNAWIESDMNKHNLTLIAKYSCARHVKETSDLLAQIYGALSFQDNNQVNQIVRDAPVFSTIEGTAEVVELVIGTPYGALT